jgi:SAM-dependent methyltransferase
MANLSLHYFDRLQTEKIFADIARLLAPGGIFAFRVNAYDETGAPIDPESWVLTTVDGVPKQFFTVKKIADLLAPSLDQIAVEKRTTDRYARTKSIFEVIARKKTGATSHE